MQNSDRDESECGFMCCLFISKIHSEHLNNLFLVCMPPEKYKALHESKAKKAKLVNCSPLFLMNRGKAGQFKDT